MFEQANIARGSNPVRYQESIIDIKIDLQVETTHQRILDFCMVEHDVITLRKHTRLYLMWQ